MQAVAATISICANLLMYQGIQHFAEKVVPGRFGGQRIVLDVRDPSKVRLKQKYGASREFPPGYLIKAVGDPKLAEYIGFAFVGESQYTPEFFEMPGRYTIPDEVELNGAIDWINAQISDASLKIPLRYYSTTSKIDPKVYLTRYAERGELPVASKGHFFIHDVTAHAFAMFLMPEVVRYSRAQVGVLLEYEAWLNAHYPKIYGEIDFQSFWREEAIRIDFSNANILGKLGAPLGSELNGDPGNQIRELVANGVPLRAIVSTTLLRGILFGSYLNPRAQREGFDRSGFERATEEFMKEISHRPEFKDYYDTLISEFLLNSGSFHQRISYLRSVLKLKP